MPPRVSDHDYLHSQLPRSHIPSARSAEDLSDNEIIHMNALAEAQVKHERVRESAIRAYKNNELKLNRENLLRAQVQVFERLRIEEENAAIAARVQELQRKAIPVPAPTEPTPPLPPTVNPGDIAKEAPTSIRNNPITPATSQDSLSGQSSQSTLRPTGPDLRRPLESNAPSEPADPRKQPTDRKNIPQKETPVTAPSHIPQSQYGARSGSGQASKITSQPIYPGSNEYIEIHKRLKQVRAFIMGLAKKDPTLKRVGEMRREIRKCVGQLTEGKGANTTPMRTIFGLLKEALYKLPSPPFDPSGVMLLTPRPNDEALNNGDTLPILFIYLLNMFSKAIIAQLADEAGVSTKFADPIGVVAVSTFAQAEFCWRGKPLIDILICKFRVVCPVLFGIRGNEKTEEGRKRVGWWRGDSGEWVSDQVHNTRMTGFGAGYAGISLRDFSKSKNQNPYPPTKYWQSMAVIVNTPPEQTSSTQYIVLKAMIENFEQRFLGFYGSAAKAALRVALVNFPSQAPEKSVAVASLKVLADKLRRDMGLEL